MARLIPDHAVTSASQRRPASSGPTAHPSGASSPAAAGADVAIASRVTAARSARARAEPLLELVGLRSEAADDDVVDPAAVRG